MEQRKERKCDELELKEEESRKVMKVINKKVYIYARSVKRDR
jgi:hypothetical protein